MKVSIVVFEINEIDGMRAMMPQIQKDWYDQLIIVDGGSTDGTIEFAREQGYDLFVQREKGVGSALNEAMERVTGDIIILYAPDGSFLPDRIPLMIEKMKQGYDIVNVTRYCDGAKSFDDNFFTGLGNWFFTRLANLVFRVKLTDFLYTYLAFRREILEELKIDNQMRTWGQIVLLRGIKRNMKIIEIPGSEPLRIGGKVKVPKLRAAYQLFVTILKERLQDYPVYEVDRNH